MALEPGQMVLVPLGRRPVQGVVLQLTDMPQVDVTRDVLASVDPSPLVTPIALDLARWISRYYLSPLFPAVALMLPPGFGRRVRSNIRLTTSQDEVSCPGLSPAILDALGSGGELLEKVVVNLLGRNGERELRRLLARGLLGRRWELLRPKASYRYDCYIRAVGSDEAAKLSDASSPQQRTLLEALAPSHSLIPLPIANKEYGARSIGALVEKGSLALEWVRVTREPALQRQTLAEPEAPFSPTPEQQGAVTKISDALDSLPKGGHPFLLHGVTGSGKTEVYMRALERCVAMGKRGIFLVPEIALTPQTVHRLNARFPGRVAVLHSRLSTGEQFDQWWRIRYGEYDVVVGPRSALFAPLPDLGLIVMDEEHEWTYKQQDAAPHYHARTVAIKLAELAGAVVALGSATPDVETYFRAAQGKYTLLELPRRVSTSGTGGSESAPKTQVEVCDMRRELKEGNRGIFSRSLATALHQTIDKGGQAILFLNRRGSSSVVQCRDCGSAMTCRRCSVTLTYHAADTRLRCHLCNRRTRLPNSCPQCRSPRIRYLGLGTQRVVEQLTRLIPQVTILRWDRDSAHSPRAHEQIMESFLRGEGRVLVGTQMVAKGLHVPNVTLVGAVMADIGLNLPDFRASERTFQLLCQVAGRAGRGRSPGRVIIQTYNPAHYSVQAAARQDYARLYSKEVQYRWQQANPPFNQLVHLVYLDNNDRECQQQAERMGRVLRQRAYSLGLTDVEVIGPAPASPERIRGRYRWHVVLRGGDLNSFLKDVPMPPGWTVDVDPVTVL